MWWSVTRTNKSLNRIGEAPFQVRRATPMDTYQLTTTKGEVMPALYHRDRLKKANVVAIPPSIPWHEKQISEATADNEELEEAVNANSGVLETKGGSNIVRDSSETPLRREMTLGGVPRRSFVPNKGVVKRREAGQMSQS